MMPGDVDRKTTPGLVFGSQRSRGCPGRLPGMPCSISVEISVDSEACGGEEPPEAASPEEEDPGEDEDMPEEEEDMPPEEVVDMPEEPDIPASSLAGPGTSSLPIPLNSPSMDSATDIDFS